MIFRGAVWEIKALPSARGNEQQGRRYAVIIQSDRFASGTVTVALTSTRAGPAIYRPENELEGSKTHVLTDQIHSVAPERLGEFQGSLDGSELAELDRALLLKFGSI